MEPPNRQKAIILTATLIASLALTAQAGPKQPTGPLGGPPDFIWYNGDFEGEGTGALANEDSTSIGSGDYAHIYDDFIVPAGGADIITVFSNNLLDTNVTAATWEIRQGVSFGNGGTLVASGMTVTPIVTLTGRSDSSLTEYMIAVAGLSLHLDEGTYWLNVTPVGDLTGRSFNSTTSGTNCVGPPCGDDGNAFFDSSFTFPPFQPTTDFCSQCADFSMGINPPFDFALAGAASIQRDFAIFLPVGSSSGVEDRAGHENKKYKIAMFFNEALTSVGSVGSDCGIVTDMSINGNAVNLALLAPGRVCNATYVTITLTEVVGALGDILGSASLTMGLLRGDVNGDGVVDRADGYVVGQYFGQQTNSFNFRADVSNNGVIDSDDKDIVKREQGTSLP